jgi:hypothetical protein
MTPAFLTRVGEAAAGYPDAVPGWWTAHLKPVNGKFKPRRHPTQAEANDNVQADPTRGAVGPVVAPIIPGGGVQTNVARVTIEFKDGSHRTLQGEDYDAVFWGYPAVEKFVIPYYVSVVDLEYGMRIDEEAKQPDMILAHSPDTEYRIYTQPAKRTGETLELLL